MSEAIATYGALLGEIRTRVRQSQTRAALSANREMIALYWDVGRLIQERQQRAGWGAGIIPRLSRDLRGELPGLEGFSERNLKRMTQFYRAYPGLPANGPQPVAHLDEPDEKGPRPVAPAGENADTLRHPDDQPSIGLILCQDEQRVLAEYALRGMDKPIGISAYELTRALPAALASALPSIDAIETELGPIAARPRGDESEEEVP